MRRHTWLADDVSGEREGQLVAQDKCLVEHYQRQPEDRWLLSEANSLEDVVELPAIECRLALADVYEKVIVAM